MYGILAAAILAAYASAAPGGFVWIDVLEIPEAGYRITSWQDLGLIWTLTLDQFMARGEQIPQVAGGYWRPLNVLSVSLDWWLFGERTWAYHLENIAWHIAVVMGLYTLGLRLIGERRAEREPVAGTSLSTTCAWGATLLFAVHPLGVHSVTWISGRKDLMCAAFMIASLLAVLNAGDRVAPGMAGRRAKWAVVAVICALAAMLSKELGLVLPLLATALAWWKWGRALFYPQRFAARTPGVSPRGRATPALLALAGVWLIALAVILYRRAMFGGVGLATTFPADGLLRNITFNVQVAWHYVGRVFLMFYPALPTPSDAWPVPREVGALDWLARGGAAAALVFAATALARRWVVALPLAWYLILAAPSMGLLPLRHAKAERYLYPASWGLLLLLTMAIVVMIQYVVAKRNRSTDAPQRRWLRFAPYATFACLAVWLGATTAIANPLWWSNQSLFKNSTDRDPHHAEGWVNLAHAAFLNGQYEDAIALASRAIETGTDPHYRAQWSTYAVLETRTLARLELGRPLKALEDAERLAQLGQHAAKALYYLGAAHEQLGRFERARAFYRRSFARDSSDSFCRTRLALVELQLGNAASTEELLRPLVQAEPDHLRARATYAAALVALGHYDEALPHLQYTATQLPGHAPTWARLAEAQWHTNRRDAARQSWRRAATIDPEHPAVKRVGELVE